MQGKRLRVAPGTGIVQGHYATRTEWLEIWGWKRGIVHHVQPLARQDKRKPELLEYQFIGGWADNGIKRVLERHKIWMHLARKKEDIPYRWLVLFKQKQMSGNLRGVAKNPRRTPPDSGEINSNAQRCCFRHEQIPPFSSISSWRILVANLFFDSSAPAALRQMK